MSDDAARTLMIEADQMLTAGAPSLGIESRLLAALELVDDDSSLKFSCALALAELVGERALDVETDELERALGFARAAEHAGRNGVAPDHVYAKALSVLGRALVRVSSRLAEPASSECARDGEAALRQAFASTSSDHPAYAKRAGNLASAILGLPHDSAHEQSRVAEAAELFRSLSIPTLL